jgi:hypothetical protein
MRPAFSSTRSAAAFALLLLMLLALPLVVGKNLLPPREQAYSVQGWGNGPYPWIRHEIFEETNDIDIAILGSSHILHAINTPYLQAKLSEKLGRSAAVRTIAWGGAGYDALFFVTQDLLAHRHVKMLVFYDENPEPGTRPGNSAATAWFRFGDNADALRGLSLPEQEQFYFAAIVGMPRNLLELVRPNLPAPLVSNPPNYWERHYGSASIVKLLGATRSELGFATGSGGENFNAFTPFTPHTTAMPTDVEVYSSTEKNDFEFASTPLPAWQIHFARKLAKLAGTNGCQLAMLHLPVLADAPVTAIQERAYWPDVFQTQVTLIGISPAKLFAGLTDEQLHWLFTNGAHFNQNGMDYFTRLVTPTLLKIYEASTNN